jgi:hypothetical protein
LGVEGEKGAVNVMGFNTQVNYNLDNGAGSFQYGFDLGLMPECDVNPATVGAGGTCGFQRYMSTKGNTTTVGFRVVARAYGELGFKGGFIGAGAFKGGGDGRLVSGHEITFKNGSINKLSLFDRVWSFNPINPIPSVGRGLQLARENPNDITVTTFERVPLKLYGRFAGSVGAYAGIGGKLSAFVGIARTEHQGTSTTRTER